MFYNRPGGTQNHIYGSAGPKFSISLLRDENEKKNEIPVYPDLFLGKTEIQMVTVKIK